MALTAKQVVDVYIFKIYNEKQVDLVRTYCANPMARHDPGQLSFLNHDQQIARMTAVLDVHSPYFENIVYTEEGGIVTAVWQSICRDGPDKDRKYSGIEIFKVTDGVISDVWNSTYMDGYWA